MQLQRKKIFLTGADGFIGSHLAEYLLALGCDVRALVLYNALGTWGWLDYIPAERKNNLEVVMGDVRDPYAIKKAMQGCDCVFHLAALIGIPYSYHAPDSYVDTNIKGTLNILQAARELNISKVVHTSTSEVYGTARYVPIDEAHPLQGQSPYSASKIGADQLAMSFYSSFDLPVTIIRPFNTFGPRQSARAFIPTVILQIAAGHQQIKLGSLHPTRDFTFVEDMVKAFVAVAESERVNGEVINIGSNFEISMQNVASMIAELMHADITITQDTQRVRPLLSEVERLCADHRKALSLTNWQPEYIGIPGFRQGLQKTIEWFVQKDNPSRYKVAEYNI